MVISFFFKQYKRKKKVKITTAERKGVPPTAEEHIVEDGDNLTPDEEEIADALADDGALMSATADDDQVSHDKKVVETLRARAIREMQDQYGVRLLNAEDQEALGIFPKACIFDPKSSRYSDVWPTGCGPRQKGS